jgi:hypothetical protein
MLFDGSSAGNELWEGGQHTDLGGMHPRNGGGTSLDVHVGYRGRSTDV